MVPLSVFQCGVSYLGSEKSFEHDLQLFLKFFRKEGLNGCSLHISKALFALTFSISLSQSSHFLNLNFELVEFRSNGHPPPGLELPSAAISVVGRWSYLSLSLWLGIQQVPKQVTSIAWERARCSMRLTIHGRVHTLSIRTHEPPGTFGVVNYHNYGEGEREYNNYGEFGCEPRAQADRAEYALDNPPISGKIGDDTFEFTIRKVVISPKPIYYDEDSGHEDDDDEYDPDYYIPGWKCNYSNETRASLALKDPKLPLDDDRYNGPIAVTERVQLPGEKEQGPRECVAKIYDAAYYLISLDDTFVRNPAGDGLPPDCATPG